MALINEDTAAEVIGGMKAARSAAYEQIERGKNRLRSTSKTRKSVLTRKRIMDAARELMVERGGTDFQMSEVSERCHMSKGALYYYFADRDELIGAIFDESVDELVGGIESVVAHAPSARDALSRLFGEFARRLRAGSPLALAMTHQLARSGDTTMPEVSTHFVRATRVIATQLELAKQEGLIRPEVDGTVAAVFATAGFIAVSLDVARRQGFVDPDDVANQLLDMTLRGIGAEGVVE